MRLGSAHTEPYGIQIVVDGHAASARRLAMLQRRAVDGEWERVDETVCDSPTGGMLAMVSPFQRAEKRMCERHGLPNVPVVVRPTFMGEDA